MSVIDCNEIMSVKDIVSTKITNTTATISYKTLIDRKPLWIRFDKIVGLW